MHNYSHYPPFKLFNNVLKTCPKAAYLYVQLWDACLEVPKYHVKSKDIAKVFLTSPTLFFNQIVQLAKLDILKFTEYRGAFYIEFISHD